MKRRLKPRTTAGTSKHRSKFETRVCDSVNDRGLRAAYEAIKFVYQPPPRTYTADWLLLDNGVVVETKGFFPAEDRSKMLLIKQQFPELDIRIVFMDATKLITKKSKTTYGAWATQHGFPWAQGDIPTEWFNE